MKNTKKILTLLLTLALFAMCFSLAAYANGAEKTVEEQIEENRAAYAEALNLDGKLLEFYEAGTYFELRVEDSELVLSDSDFCKLLKGGAYSEAIEGDMLHISSFNPTRINLTENGSFGVNFLAELTENTPITLYVASSETGDYMSLFSIEAAKESNSGKITHKFDTASLSYEVADSLAFSAGDVAYVSIYVEKGDSFDTVTVNVTDGDTVEYFTTTYSYSNDATDFLVGSFKYDSAYLATKDAKFGYVEMYPGTFQRYVDNSFNKEAIADGIIKAYEDYNTFKSLDGIENGAFELAEMISKVAVIYDYTYIGAYEKSSVVTEAFDECIAIVSAAYAAEVEAANAAIVAEDFEKGAYNDKLDAVKAVFAREEYMSKLEASEYAALGGVDFEKIAEAVVNAENAFAKLNVLEANAIYVIEELSKIANIYLVTYEELKTAYAAVLSVTIDPTYYSEFYTADEVNEAYQKRNKVMADYPVLNAKALAFVENMAIATDMTVDFSTRYASYVIAKDNMFADVTYDKYLTDTTISELLADYEVLNAEMVAVSDYAEAFLSKIREAALTPSYNVKINALDAAKPYLADVEVGYPEVADAIASYYAMREDIASRKEAAKRYIQAVLNVQIATTVKEKAVAIEIAEGFALLGQELSVEVDGMPITVNEANIILSNEKSAITLKSTRINNYVAATAAIAKKQTLLERRVAINAAIALQAGLTADLEEDDVIAATAVLNAAIDAYNADVNAANSVAEEKEEVALNLAAMTVPSKKIAEVIAIIKKFYE